MTGPLDFLLARSCVRTSPVAGNALSALKGLASGGLAVVVGSLATERRDDMSDSILRIIPSEPAFVPGVDARQSVASLLREAFPQAGGVDVRVEDDVGFVDAGENFGAIFCPQCRRELVPEWWADAMDRAAASRFVDLTVKTPCCGHAVSLNDLRYEMPQGFARCVVEVTNPDAAELPPGFEARLRDLLGCQLRFVWAHF